MKSVIVEPTPKQGKGGIKNSTNPKHLEWIENYLHNIDYSAGNEYYLRGECWSASTSMLVSFPDLILVSGYAISAKFAGLLLEVDFDPGNGHWWLETSSGEIVDPTRKQYGSENLIYVAFDESKADTLPTGKCLMCGFYCYNGKDFCCCDCSLEYSA